MKLGDNVKITSKKDKFFGHKGKIVKIADSTLSDAEGNSRPVKRYLLEGQGLTGAAVSELHTFKDALTGELVEISTTKRSDNSRWVYDFMVEGV